uniref:RNA helicase n=1 Tax=Ciona savignyi TaxID=51511 RepID=H2YPU8_CIOSA
MKSIRTILSCSRVRLLNIQPVHRSIALHRPCPVKHTNPFSAVTQSSPIAAEQRNIDNDHGELDLDSLFKDITPTYEEERHYDGDRNSYASNFNFSGVDYSEKEDFERNFYEEHPDCAQRDPAEINEFYQRNGIKVSGVNRPNPILDFSEISFTDYINSKLLKSGFKVPTAIQSISWPATLAGSDVVGIAQTGSGKTLSFILPALIHIQAQRPLRRGEGPIALVLCPTREL